MTERERLLAGLYFVLKHNLSEDRYYKDGYKDIAHPLYHSKDGVPLFFGSEDSLLSSDLVNRVPVLETGLERFCAPGWTRKDRQYLLFDLEDNMLVEVEGW